jgi:dTDP-4-amino-4,6-dideoxygalactose transaminase
MNGRQYKRTPFNRPHMSGKELTYIAEAHFNGQLAGDGPFTMRCHEWLEAYSGSPRALLTHSCTAALEMAALLLDIAPGDEVIMPSYTFVSTANAFVLRGATPVFVDIREDTLNLDEEKIEAAITNRTKAIVVVHYAGVACDMDPILNIARTHGLKIVEDAAQGLMSTYNGKPLGSIGDLGTLSFHETKNVISGEGGALLINDPRLTQRGEIIREKGTDRSRFFRGEVDKYTWQDIGSSFLPGELIAAFLWAQFEEAKQITLERMARWNFYHDLAAPLEDRGILRRPIVPENCIHNGHMYYVLLPSPKHREVALNELKKNNVNSVFHYVPLHSSPAGVRYGRTSGSLDVTVMQSERLVRLPMFVGLTVDQQCNIIHCLASLTD